MRFRSINVVLRCPQFDLAVVPEYRQTSVPPPESPQTPQTTNRSAAAQASPQTAFIPYVPSSQFYICYSIAPPHPPHSYFYFKMFIAGRHVVSWGVGNAEGYRGETNFALYDHAPTDLHSDEADEDLRRHAFFFRAGEPVRNLSDNIIEVKVYRSYGRKFIPRKGLVSKPGMAVAAPIAANFSLRDAGAITEEQDPKFFVYALVDPLSNPFAVFRWMPLAQSELDVLPKLSRTVPTISPASTRENSRNFPSQPIGQASNDADNADNRLVLRPERSRSNSRRLTIPPSVVFEISSVGSGTSISPLYSQANVNASTADFTTPDHTGPIGQPSISSPRRSASPSRDHTQAQSTLASPKRESFLPRLLRKVKSTDSIRAPSPTSTTPTQAQPQAPPEASTQAKAMPPTSNSTPSPTPEPTPAPKLKQKRSWTKFRKNSDDASAPSSLPWFGRK